MSTESRPPTPDEKEYLEAFSGLVNKSQEIVDWKVNRTLEEAKLLSVNPEFQKAVAELRGRWKIEPHIQEEAIHPAVLLREYTSHLDETGREQLDKELQGLARKFDLDWSVEGEDFGLVVAAVCYGLTPDNLIRHWERIKLTAARTRTPGARLILADHEHVKKQLVNMIVTSYLFLQLKEAGIEFPLPGPIKEVVLEALKAVGKLGETPERAAAFIEKIQEMYLPPDLHVKIDRNTTLEDIKRTWPQVELRKTEHLPRGEGRKNSRKRRRPWRTYERDIFIWRKVKKGGLTYEDAYNEWLSSHPGEDPVEITAVIHAATRIQEVPNDD